MTKGSLALALWVSCGLFASAQDSRIGGLKGNASSGKALYRRYCITCHGKHGDGAGESAPYLDPKPRDFTKAAFKCRSTPSGSLPTDTDLYNTIRRGIYNSGMPSWLPLTRQQRADLVAYIKTFYGKEGRGNGPSALALTDSKGYPIRPFDFTDGSHFKCGETPGDLFKDLATGLDGTPMPSFADSLKSDQIWDLVHYIQTLNEENRGLFHHAKSEHRAQ